MGRCVFLGISHAPSWDAGPQRPAPPPKRDLLDARTQLRNNNQILHVIKLDEKNFHRVDHAHCPGQKLLWHECWYLFAIADFLVEDNCQQINVFKKPNCFCSAMDAKLIYIYVSNFCKLFINEIFDRKSRNYRAVPRTVGVYKDYNDGFSLWKRLAMTDLRYTKSSGRVSVSSIDIQPGGGIPQEILNCPGNLLLV